MPNSIFLNFINISTINAEKLIPSSGQFFDRTLFTISGTKISLFSIIIFFSIILIAIIFSSIIQKVLRKTLQRRFASRQGTLSGLLRLVHYSIMIAGMGLALEIVGIKIHTLFAAGAVFALAIGFAMQNIIQNFVSGVILLLERSIKPGDIIEVEGRVVKVITMGIRTTVVRTWKEEDLIVPNSIFSQTLVKNFTLKDHQFRIEIEVGVSYDSDMAKVLNILEATAESIPWRVPQIDIRVQLLAFGASSVEFGVSLGIDDPWNQRKYLSDLRKAIWFALQEAKITIAYPQLDLHLGERFFNSLEHLAQIQSRDKSQGNS